MLRQYDIWRPCFSERLQRRFFRLSNFQENVMKDPVTLTDIAYFWHVLLILDEKHYLFSPISLVQLVQIRGHAQRKRSVGWRIPS